MKNNSRLNSLTLFQLIGETGINKAHLASKMQMPAGTFKNKLSDKQDKYRFTDEEEARLIEILKDIAETIEVTAGISFNRALATIVK